ncbi:lipoprotein [Streptomyces sp. MK7]|uniref:lipoprotein n=1 Tax=Streptomyces sp. MK7 TaxID=3067635 RepID=UPI0029309C9F|nr:lipoprotein [Streptomyces sp. MK7]
MSIGAGTAWWAAVAAAVLLGGALTGCSQTSDDDGHRASRKQTTAGDTATAGARTGAGAKAAGGVARRGGSVGAAMSACPLPVSFDVAAGWKASAVDPEAVGDSGQAKELADAVLRQGPVTAACEIDAKPAGNIGFLRVYTGKSGSGDARSVLRAFVAAEGDVSEERYGPVTAGGLDGVEVEYRHRDRALDETTKESALAVVTPKGPVVLHLDGLDAEEHDHMLPAYELAKRTLRPA